MSYIYTISCPKTQLVRYVGKTDNPDERFRKHLTEKGRSKKCNWIKGLKNKGLKPVFEIIDECDNWEEAERNYIKLFRSVGADLLNEMPGGEGGPTMLGKKLTKEQAAKISASKIGKPNPTTSRMNKELKGKRVIQWTLDGVFVAKHKSIYDAARAINRSSRRIQMMISGGKKTVNHVGGYRFTEA